MKTNIVSITTQTNDVPSFMESTLSTNIWFSGCNLKCDGCQNPSLQEKRRGLELETVLNEIEKRRQLTDWIVIMGGEPFNDRESISYINDILFESKKIGYKTMIYSGYTYDQIEKKVDECGLGGFWKNVDIIKVGSYDVNYVKTSEEFFFATLNQELVDRTGKRLYYYDLENKKAINL